MYVSNVWTRGGEWRPAVGLWLSKGALPAAVHFGVASSPDAGLQDAAPGREGSELMSCNYLLQRPASVCIRSGFLLPRAPPPRRHRPRVPARVPTASSRNKLFAEQMASKGDTPPLCPGLSCMG